MLNPEQTYYRKNHIIYDESGNAILKCDEKTADATGLTGQLVVNMNNYIRYYPDRVEILEQKPQTNVQLNLF